MLYGPIYCVEKPNYEMAGTVAARTACLLVLLREGKCVDYSGLKGFRAVNTFNVHFMEILQASITKFRH